MSAYTDPVPLGRSTDWPEYVADYALPVIYGRVRIAPRPYDRDGTLWLLAGHPIAGVDRVELGGSETDGWVLQNGVDPTGRAIAVLETAQPVASADDLKVELRGKMHPRTGDLLDRPDLILWDWLAGVCGMPVSQSALDDLRSWSQDNGIRCGGMIDDASQTIQSATDSIAAGMGLAWSAALAGVAIPWPGVPAGIAETLDVRADDVEAAASAGDITTRLRIDYAMDWAAGRPGRSLIMDAPGAMERYGMRESTITAAWITDTRSAESMAERWLRWYAGPSWEINARTAQPIAVGSPVTLDHPHCPATTAVCIAATIGDTDTAITCLAGADYSGEVRVVRRSTGADLDARTDTTYTYRDGLLTYTVRDAAGRPLAGARITLDGAQTRSTDVHGRVQFRATRGRHVLTIEAAGYQTQTVEVTI